MYKKVIIISIESIIKYPPTIALIRNLILMNRSVYLFTTDDSEAVKQSIDHSVQIVKIGSTYSNLDTFKRKLQRLISIRRNIWKEIDKIYDEESILWVMSNITLKHLNHKLFNYRYNLHLFELMEDVYLVGNKRITSINLGSYCSKAKNVIVCEYNRSLITKAWFQLKNTPIVIVNKPINPNIPRDSNIEHSEKAKKLIETLHGKFIILYQGVVDEERPIEFFSKAIERMPNKYAFVVMTGSNVEHLRKYKKTYIIDYIPAPFHLEVTSHANIGILFYVLTYHTFTSPLNSLYCAPNKLYEYSYFGIPMIGNDIPGLRYTISSSQMGVCLERMDIDQIQQAIIEIERNYEKYSQSSRNFYKSDSNIKNIECALNDE